MKNQTRINKLLTALLTLCALFVCMAGAAMAAEGDCDHSGNTSTATNNGDGTHSYTCSVCKKEVGGDAINDTATLQIAALTELTVGNTVVMSGGEVQTSSGTGWSYDHATNTLTLNGANITDYYSASSIEYTPVVCGIYCDGELNLALTGSSTVTINAASSEASYVYGIYAKGDLSITGSGSLAVSTGDHAGSIAAIKAVGNLVIGTGSDAPTVTATGGTASGDNSPYSSGIEAASVTISGGTVTATGGNAAGSSAGIGLTGSDYLLRINSGKVKATAGTSQASTSAGIFAKQITVTQGSTAELYAEGKNYGVYYPDSKDYVSDGIQDNASTLDLRDGNIHAVVKSETGQVVYTASAKIPSSGYYRTAADGTFDTSTSAMVPAYDSDAQNPGTMTTYFEYVSTSHLGHTDNQDGTHDLVCKAGCGMTTATVVDNEVHTPEKNAAYTGNGDRTHSFTCSVCGLVATEGCSDFTYTVSADGATCTMSCELCQQTLDTVTIVAPACETYGDGESCEATLLVNGEEFAPANGFTYYQYVNDAWVKLEAAPANAGTYRAENAVRDTEYESEKVIIYVEYSIEKAAPTYTAPTAIENPVYKGFAQALVNAGTAAGGAMQYAVGADSATAPTDGWSTDIPTGIHYGAYYVWYRVQGDSNHNDSTPQCLTATIAPAPVTITGLTATDRAYDGTTYVTPTGGSLEGLIGSDQVTIDLSGAKAVMADANAGDGKAVTVTGVTLSGDAAGNYELRAQPTNVTVNIAKAQPAAPTGVPAAYGQKLADVDLPEGWSWADGNIVLNSLGEKTCLANYAGDQNHLSAKNVDVTVTVGQSATDMTAKADKTAYTYGETAAITVTPAATGVSAYGPLARLAAPAAGTVSLWNGETQLTEGKPAASGQAVTFTLNTVTAGLVPGAYTLTAKYAASAEMAAQTADVSFTVSYAQDEPESDAAFSGEQGGAGWYTEAPSLTAPEDCEISLTPDSWTGKTGNTVTLPAADGAGEYTYYVRLPDDTIAEKSVTVKVDTAPPAMAEPAVLADPTTAQISAPATDAGSGVEDYALTQTGGEGDVTITNNGGGSFALAGLTPGETYTFALTVTDAAGNTTTAIITVTAPLMPTLPDTGDGSRMALCLALMALACTGMLALRRKAEN